MPVLVYCEHMPNACRGMQESTWSLANLRPPTGAAFHLYPALEAAIGRSTGHPSKRGTFPMVVRPGMAKTCLGVDKT